MSFGIPPPFQRPAPETIIDETMLLDTVLGVLVRLFAFSHPILTPRMIPAMVLCQREGHRFPPPKHLGGRKGGGHETGHERGTKKVQYNGKRGKNCFFFRGLALKGG